jgi:hypothetical protein
MKHLLLALGLIAVAAPAGALMGITQQGKQCTNEGKACLNMGINKQGTCLNGACVVGCQKQAAGATCSNWQGNAGTCISQPCATSTNPQGTCLVCKVG